MLRFFDGNPSTVRLETALSFRVMPGCTGGNLGGILVEVPPVAAKRDGLPLDFIAKGAEQGLDPASSPGNHHEV